jgi:rhomboid protease GluP
MQASTLVKVGVVVVVMAATVQVVVRVVPEPVTVTRSLFVSLRSEWRRPKPLTLLVAAITTAGAIWQALWPGLLDHAARHHDTISSGRWWQFATELVVQSPLWQAPINILALLVVGATVERLFGPVRWLLLYLGGAAVGEAFAMSWQPEGAGNSIAVLGLLGGLFAFFLREHRDVGVRLLVVLALAGGGLLVYYHNIHGPALLAGAVLGLPLVRRRRDAELPVARRP